MLTEFTPIASLLGGALIGLSAVVLMASLGRIAGLTGLVRGALPPWTDGQADWRFAFLLGAVLAPVVLFALHYDAVSFSVPAPAWTLPLSGVAVGIGVTYGNGCPSGHGVCGLARFSPRSLVAVAAFMATAAVTVFVRRHILGA